MWTQGEWGKDSGCNHVLELNDIEDGAALALKHKCQWEGHNNCTLLVNTAINICLVFQTVTCDTKSTFGFCIDDNYLMWSTTACWFMRVAYWFDIFTYPHLSTDNTVKLVSDKGDIFWIYTKITWNYSSCGTWWHVQKPHFVFPRNGRVHLNRWGCQFSRLLAADVCASAVVMLDTPRCEVMWEYWLPTPFASFPFTSPPVHHRVPPGSERALLQKISS